MKALLVALLACIGIILVFSAYTIGHQHGVHSGYTVGRREAIKSIQLGADNNYLQCIDQCDDQKAVYLWVNEYKDKPNG